MGQLRQRLQSTASGPPKRLRTKTPDPNWLLVHSRIEFVDAAMLPAAHSDMHPDGFREHHRREWALRHSSPKLPLASSGRPLCANHHV